MFKNDFITKVYHSIRNHTTMLLREGGELSSGELKVENIHNISGGDSKSGFQIHWILTETLLNQNNQMRVRLFTIWYLQTHYRGYTWRSQETYWTMTTGWFDLKVSFAPLSKNISSQSGVSPHEAVDNCGSQITTGVIRRNTVNTVYIYIADQTCNQSNSHRRISSTRIQSVHRLHCMSTVSWWSISWVTATVCPTHTHTDSGQSAR